MHKYSQYIVPISNNCVDFSISQPDIRKRPFNFFKKSLVELGESLDDPSILQYGMKNGYLSFRESLASWLNKKNYSDSVVNSDELFITNGVTGALQLIINQYLSTDDTILVEEPSYNLAIDIFKEYGLDVDYIPMTNDGLNIEVLEEKVRHYCEKQKSIFLYTIPTCHNPTGITLPDSKRKQLAAIAAVYTNFYVIADEVYHFMRWNNDDRVLPMSDYHSNFISLGSFSKILAPSLRVGWVYSNNKFEDRNDDTTVIEDLNSNALLDSSGGLSVLGSLVAHKAIETGFLDEYIDTSLIVLRTRLDIIKNKLSKQDIFKYNEPDGGYLLWLESKIDTCKTLDLAKINKVKFLPGNKFSCINKLNKYLRLSYSQYEPDDLSIGIDRLIKCFEEYNKIKVGILGRGKLGTEIERSLNEDFKEKYLVKLIIKRGDFSNNKILDSLQSCDVIIDVSSPSGTIELISFLEKNNISIPILSGTTGHNEASTLMMQRYGKNQRIMNINNFSKGIPIIKQMISFINNLEDEWKVKIIDNINIEGKTLTGTAQIIGSALTKNCIVETKKTDHPGFTKIVCDNKIEVLEFNHKNLKVENLAVRCIEKISSLLESDKGFTTDINIITSSLDYKVYSAHGNIIAVVEDFEGEDHSLEVKKIIKSNEDVDGVIFISEVTTQYKSCNWLFYNNNGKEAAFCGNAIRCLVKYVYDKYKIDQLSLNYNDGISSELYLASYNNGDIMVESPLHSEDDDFDNLTQTLLEQECEKFDLEVHDIEFHHVGVPHLVIELKDNVLNLSDILLVLGNIINDTYQEKLPYESSSSEKQGVNVNFINLNTKDHDHSINIVTWERGVNKITKSCGSGSLASFYYYLNDRTIRSHQRNVDINYFNGTTAQVLIKNDLYDDEDFDLDSNTVFLQGEVNNYDMLEEEIERDDIRGLFDVSL